MRCRHCCKSKLCTVLNIYIHGRWDRIAPVQICDDIREAQTSDIRCTSLLILILGVLDLIGSILGASLAISFFKVHQWVLFSICTVFTGVFFSITLWFGYKLLKTLKLIWPHIPNECSDAEIYYHPSSDTHASGIPLVITNPALPDSQLITCTPWPSDLEL